MSSRLSSNDLNLVLALEREVQTLQGRADEHRLTELFALDFIEVGASSRRWDLASMLAMLREESHDVDAGVIEVVGLEARELATDVVQVFWTSDRKGRRARRTSIRCRRDGRWQLVYHQGTLIPE